MKEEVLTDQQQKFIVVFIASLASFLGFQAVSEAIRVYQIDYFLSVSFYVYLFLVFWQSFVFDLELRATYQWSRLDNSFWEAFKKRFHYLLEFRHFLNYQNYLILPGIIYWCTIILLYLNPFEILLKQAFIVGSTLALTVVFWYSRTIFYRHIEHKRNARQFLFRAKILGSYIAFAATIGISHYFGFDVMSAAIAVFALSYLLFHQAFFQHNALGFTSTVAMVVGAFIVAVTAAIVYLVWNANYFSAALAVTAVYNTVWGYIQHKHIDRDITRELVYEYLAALFVILVILVNTTNFSQRI